jgi:hypothetical protein
MYGEVLSPPPGAPLNYLVGGDTTVDTGLAPASSIVNYGDLSIFRIGEGVSCPPLQKWEQRNEGHQRAWPLLPRFPSAQPAL